MSLEIALYLLTLLFILVTSVVNCLLSISIFIKLRIEMALLLAAWPLTVIVPVIIELYHLRLRLQGGIITTSMGARWTDVVTLLAVTILQFSVLTHGDRHHYRR